MKRFVLIAIVFICGAGLMIMELVGSRILAPYVGTSLLVWTTLIGVILAALSFGYWIGGRYADQYPSPKHLGAIIILAGFFIFLALWLSRFLPEINLVLINWFSLGGAAFCISCLLFVIPSILLGAVSPFALRLSLNETAHSGAIGGQLYAFSTLGSIVGTFLAGFVLIPQLGSFKTLALVSVILVLCGVILLRTKTTLMIMVFIAVGCSAVWSNAFVFSPGPNVLAEYESAYNRLFIVNGISQQTKEPILSIMSGPHISQSAMYTDRDELVFEYTQFFRMADYFNPTIESALMLGGGAYSFPKDYLKNHSGTIDVVEIDPLYTELAKKYFNLPNNERLRLHHEDARVFLSRSDEKFDAVYVDVFNNAGSVPFQLATKEVVTQIFDRLSDNGVAIVNLVGSFEGVGRQFIENEYATYQSVFPKVLMYPLDSFGGNNIQNIMLVALKNPVAPKNTSIDQEQADFLDKEYRYEIAGNVLTDDWAPVDYYLSGLY